MGSGISGWCIDSLHEKCVEFYHNKFGRPCPCKCHEKKEKK